MTPEKAIEYQILNYLTAIGVFVFKVDRQGTFDPTKKKFRSNKNPYKIKGVSDILGVLSNGRFLAIEVKKPKTTTAKGYASAEQKEFIAKVNKSGGLAFVAWSLEEVKTELAKLD